MPPEGLIFDNPMKRSAKEWIVPRGSIKPEKGTGAFQKHCGAMEMPVPEKAALEMPVPQKAAKEMPVPEKAA